MQELKKAYYLGDDRLASYYMCMILDGMDDNVEAVLDLVYELPDIRRSCINDVFVWACIRGHTKVAKCVLDIDTNRRYLMLSEGITHAILYNQLAIIKLIFGYPSSSPYLPLNEIAFAKNKLDIWYWYSQNYPSKSAAHTGLIQGACMNGNLFLAKLMKAKYPSIAIPQQCLTLVCIKGYLDVAKWLYNNGSIFENVHFFDKVCLHGHIDVAKWLISIMDCSTDIASGMRNACEGGHLELVAYLSHVYPNARIIPCVDTLSKTYIADIATARWFVKKYVKYITPEMFNYTFTDMCKSNRLEQAQWIRSAYPDVKLVDYDIMASYLSHSTKMAATFADMYPYSNCHSIHDTYPPSLEKHSDLANMIEWLINNFDLDVHTFDDTYIYTACDRGYYDVIRILANHTMYDNVSCGIANGIIYVASRCDDVTKKMTPFRDIYLYTKYAEEMKIVVTSLLQSIKKISH